VTENSPPPPRAPPAPGPLGCERRWAELLLQLPLLQKLAEPHNIGVQIVGRHLHLRLLFS